MKVQKQKLNIKAIKNILQKQFQIEKYILFKHMFLRIINFFEKKKIKKKNNNNNKKK